jgi:hypothetical protein
VLSRAGDFAGPARIAEFHINDELSHPVPPFGRGNLVSSLTPSRAHRAHFTMILRTALFAPQCADESGRNQRKYVTDFFLIVIVLAA